MKQLSFQREDITHSLYQEKLLPLLREHYREIGRHADIPLDVNIDQYVAMNRSGVLRFYTARREDDIIGYANYLICRHPHFQSSIQAHSDVLFIIKQYRGFGKEFLLWCENQLREDGVQEVYQSVTVKFNFGNLLRRIGYEQIDSTYSKRLDRRD